MISSDNCIDLAEIELEQYHWTNKKTNHYRRLNEFQSYLFSTNLSPLGMFLFLRKCTYDILIELEKIDGIGQCQWNSSLYVIIFLHE